MDDGKLHDPSCEGCQILTLMSERDAAKAALLRAERRIEDAYRALTRPVADGNNRQAAIDALVGDQPASVSADR